MDSHENNARGPVPLRPHCPGCGYPSTAGAFFFRSPGVGMMPDHTGGWMVPGPVAKADDLNLFQKVLYGRILTLCGEDGYCWAGNYWLADEFQRTTRTIRDNIAHLVDRGYMKRQVVRDESEEVVERRLYPTLNTGVETDTGDSPRSDGGRSGEKSPQVGRKTSGSRTRQQLVNSSCRLEGTNQGSPPAREQQNIPDEVEQLCFEAWGNVPSQVAQMCEEYPLWWVRIALKKAVRNNADTWHYVKKILQTWVKQDGPDDHEIPDEDNEDVPEEKKWFTNSDGERVKYKKYRDGPMDGIPDSKKL